MPSISKLDVDADSLGHVETAGFVGRSGVFASVEGMVHVLGDAHKVVQAHDGLLVAQISTPNDRLVTGGEDGRVCATTEDAVCIQIANKQGWWIDKLAIGPSGVLAFASGRKGVFIAPGGGEKPFDSERGIEGLAFAPKGMRLAIARYNGVELAWVNTNNPKHFLEWAGAHTGVVFSPDGRYVVSSMQENALHGWRLSDNKHMRMTGYPAKVKSLSFSAKGKWLASSGAPAAIVWPFSGKDGPMGKAPLELGAMGGTLMAVVVACHPREDVVAIGYSDGMILAVRIDDGKEAVLKPSGKGAISTLGWDAAGMRLAYGSETGEAGIIDISA